MMNIVLWVLQVILALLYLMGGRFKAVHPDDPAKQIRAIPPAGWRALGVYEMVGAVLLLVPALTPLAAIALAVETWVMAAVYARYSLKLSAANPLVYAVPMGVMAVLIAYGRYSLHSPA